MEHQLDRPDPQRPTVRCASQRINMWEARGYDANGQFHVAVKFSLPEVHDIATKWAASGYAEPQQ